MKLQLCLLLLIAASPGWCGWWSPSFLLLETISLFLSKLRNLCMQTWLDRNRQAYDRITCRLVRGSTLDLELKRSLQSQADIGLREERLLKVAAQLLQVSQKIVLQIAWLMTFVPHHNTLS